MLKCTTCQKGKLSPYTEEEREKFFVEHAHETQAPAVETARPTTPTPVIEQLTGGELRKNEFINELNVHDRDAQASLIEGEWRGGIWSDGSDGKPPHKLTAAEYLELKQVGPIMTEEEASNKVAQLDEQFVHSTADQYRRQSAPVSGAMVHVTLSGLRHNRDYYKGRVSHFTALAQIMQDAIDLMGSTQDD